MKIEHMMKEFEKLNISKATVLAFGKEELKRMSNKQITNDVYSFNVQGKNLEAKFSFNNEGKLMIHPKRKEILNSLKLSKNQLDLLEKGEVILKNGNLIQLDRSINELLHIEAKKVIVPKKIQGISISQEQKEELIKGKEITLKGKQEVPFKIRFNVAKGEFTVKTQDPKLKQDLKVSDIAKDHSLEKEISKENKQEKSVVKTKSKAPKR